MVGARVAVPAEVLVVCVVDVCVVVVVVVKKRWSGGVGEKRGHGWLRRGI